MSLYKPTVSCVGPRRNIPGAQIRQSLLDMIPTSAERLKFGSRGEPEVRVALPISYTAQSDPGRESTLHP